MKTRIGAKGLPRLSQLGAARNAQSSHLVPLDSVQTEPTSGAVSGRSPIRRWLGPYAIVDESLTVLVARSFYQAADQLYYDERWFPDSPIRRSPRRHTP